MAGIEIITTLGAAGLKERYGLPHRMAMKMLGLSGRGIHLSLGIADRMRADSPEKPVLERLFRRRRLKDLGKSITQEQLDQIIREVIIELRGSEIENADTATLPQLLRELDLDLELKIQAGENSITIATDDEIGASTGALVVVEEQQALVLSGDPGKLFASKQGQQILLEEVTSFQRELVSRTFRLPGTREPRDFERELGFLSPYMTEGEGNNVLVNYATKDFFGRPARSRKVIAETMIHHGLDRDLMAEIVILCGDGATEVKTEAINGLVAVVSKLTNPLELMMVVVTLIKILEEEENKTVKKHALNKIAEYAEAISRRLPNLLEDARIIPTLKKVLLADPKVYRTKIEKLIIAFGKINPEAVITPIWEDFEVVTDPYIRFAYHNILEALVISKGEKAEIHRSKWELYFDVESTNPDIAEAMLAELQANRPASIDKLTGLFSVFSGEEQIHLIKVLDNLAIELLTHADQDQRELFSCGKIVTLFANLCSADYPTEVKLAALKSRAVFAPQLTDHFQTRFWPAMAEYLNSLILDEGFVEGFVACGQNYLTLFTHHISATPEPNNKLALLRVAHKKFQAIDTARSNFEEQKQELAALLTVLITETIGLIPSPPTGVRVRELFRVVTELNKSPVMTQDTLVKTFGKLQRAARGQERAQELAIENSAELASHALISPAMAEELRNSFLSILRNQAGVIEKEDAARAETPKDATRISLRDTEESFTAKELIELSLRGLVNLVQNRDLTLNRQQQLEIINPLLTIAGRRPQKATPYQKGKKQELLPDPVRDRIIFSLEEMQSSGRLDRQLIGPISERIKKILELKMV